MDSNTDAKRKKDTRDDDDNDRRRDTKSKRARSRSRSSEDKREKDFQRKRRRRSCSPDHAVKQENEKEPPKVAEVKSETSARRAKETDMLNTRTGGAYIPPARLRLMQAQITDKSSVAYQRLAWEALKKSIHGHINKINVGNIGIIIKELLKENIVRGRGLLCRSVIQAQAASPTFTNVYAALVAAVNSRFPNIGELLLKRLVIQFKRGFKRNDKSICISSASFIAHLVNQRVAHEILALELLTLLVETPTDDSVEVSIAFLKECGQKLTEVSSKGVNAIFEMLRNILHEGQLDKRVQYMIEVMFQVWKDGFKDHPALIEELELVPEEEQFTHLLMLDDATNPQDILNVFKFDEKYEENEQRYKNLSKEILGSDAESGEEDGSGESGSGSEESDDDEGQEDRENKGVTIIDNTETNLVALRRTIYLTINSSLDFEECAHKLMKMQLKPGQEVELCHMFLDCCAEQRTYEKFYGLLAQRFCNINRIYIGPFEEIFKDSYSTAHRLDTNRLRNVSKFFAHLLFTDSISWEALECVKLNEEDTTSSSRIYIKILFQELAEYMGLKKLNDRLKDPTLQSAFSGVFPRNNPKDTRFSINFFTSIGLGGLTDELREHLKQMPKNVPPPAEITVGSSSEDSSSSSSSDSSSDSSDDSEEESSKKKKKDKNKSKKDTPPKTPDNDNAGKNQDVERWGHDGFYETYGKDAQRHERPRNERDKDNFAIPRDVPRKREQRNGDERRRNEESEDPKNRGRDDDKSDRIRKERTYGKSRDDEEQHRDRKNRNDERYDRNLRGERMDRDRDNYRRIRNESERDSGYESRSKIPNEDDRRDREKGRKDDKTESDRNEYQTDKNRENESGYESRSKRPNDDDRRDREKGRKDDKIESDRNEYQKETERESGYESRSKRPNDDDRRDREKGRKNDKAERDRNEYQKEKNSAEYDQSRMRRQKDDDRRDREITNRDDVKDGTRNEENERSKKNREKDNENERKEKRSRKKEDKEKRSDSDSDENKDEQSSRRRKRDKDRRKDDSRSKRKSNKREKENESRDGWDIRGSSIRRENPVVTTRFWDTYESKKRDSVERNPERYESGTPERREIRTPERDEIRTPDKLEKSKGKRRDR